MAETTVKDVKGYRADIDGLRAVAVLSVLAYHAFPDLLPGGFVGVDVFFVISGFLISRIILSEIDNQTFTFANFYSRRIRRIFPALFVVLAAVTLIGWYILLPTDFRRLGTHVLAGAGFFSNLLLYHEGGYFDTAAELKPLLHLWSLGIEEQYYLLWPILLIGFRNKTRQVFWFIVSIAFISFLLNIWGTSQYPHAAFYLPPTRFWELMIGGMLAYWSLHWQQADRASIAKPWNLFNDDLISLAGIACILFAFIAIRPESNFPGWWAVLPTAGTALLIIAGPRALVNCRLLSIKTMVYIGLISYPLYLWHWPLLAFGRIINGDEPPTAITRATILGISFLLAMATYELIEKNIRYARKTRWAASVVPALSTSIAAIGVLGIVIATNAVKSRSSAVPNLVAVSEALDDWRDFNGSGIVKGGSDERVMFLGDSHMAQFMPRVEGLSRSSNSSMREVIYSIRYGCAPIPGVDRLGRDCTTFVDTGYRQAQTSNIDTVIIGASWLGFVSRDDLHMSGDTSRRIEDPLADENRWIWDGLAAALSGLVKRGKKVVLILNGPVGEEFDPRRMIERHGLQIKVKLVPPILRDELNVLTTPVNSRLKQIAAIAGASVLDPTSLVCTPSDCSATDSAGNPFFMDHSHLRYSFVRDKFEALDKYLLHRPN